MEVYNLNEDPMEKEDLAAGNPQKAKSLIRMLGGYLDEAGAQPALPNSAHDPSRFSGGIRDYRALQRKKNKNKKKKKN